MAGPITRRVTTTVERCEIIVPGVAVAAMRTGTNHKTGAFYTKEKYRDYQDRVRRAWSVAGRPRLPDGHVIVEVITYMQRPKDHWRTNGKLKDWAPPVPLKPPDFDNLAKALTDPLNGLLYHDDRLIPDGHSYKRYCASQDEEPHVILIGRRWRPGDVVRAPLP